MDIYFQKYLKYKSKYATLKKMRGGSETTSATIIPYCAVPKPGADDIDVVMLIDKLYFKYMLDIKLLTIHDMVIINRISNISTELSDEEITAILNGVEIRAPSSKEETDNIAQINAALMNSANLFTQVGALASIPHGGYSGFNPCCRSMFSQWRISLIKYLGVKASCGKLQEMSILNRKRIQEDLGGDGDLFALPFGILKLGYIKIEGGKVKHYNGDEVVI